MATDPQLVELVHDIAEGLMREAVPKVAQTVAGDAPRDRGVLAESIRADRAVVRESSTVWAGTVRQVDAEAEHGKFLESGTGLFGPRGRRITPRTASVLRFQGDSGTVFARSVAGSGKHKGWWSQYDWGQAFDAALAGARLSGVR